MKQLTHLKTKLQLLLEVIKANHKDLPPPPPSGGVIVTRIIPPIPKDGKRLLTGVVVNV